MNTRVWSGLKKNVPLKHPSNTHTYTHSLCTVWRNSSITFSTAALVWQANKPSCDSCLCRCNFYGNFCQTLTLTTAERPVSRRTARKLLRWLRAVWTLIWRRHLEQTRGSFWQAIKPKKDSLVNICSHVPLNLETISSQSRLHRLFVAELQAHMGGDSKGPWWHLRCEMLGHPFPPSVLMVDVMSHHS